MNINLEKKERIDDLEYKGLKIIQNEDGFCFGIDSVLLSDFAKGIKDNTIVADLGTGTGIISILLSAKTKTKKIYGIEIQENVAEMAQRSVKLNQLEDRIEIVNEDIKIIRNRFGDCFFDAIVTNPPYKKDGSGLKNENISKVISRHETACTLEDIIKESFYVLKDKGEFYMVHRPDRLVDILYLMRENKIEPKVMRMVYSKQKEKPVLVLIKGIKNGGQELINEKPLYIYKEDGKYTDEILKIYNKI